jgi:nitroreductase
MEFAEVLRRRKMVRNYTDQPVDREVVERIVARARKAPSGGFSQGLRLVVVTEEKTRHRIAELAHESEYVCHDRPRHARGQPGLLAPEVPVEAARGGRPLGALVDELAAATIGETFNQYRHSCLRQERLAGYLDAKRAASIVLVGEAAGYRGARVSGLPFTSERQLTGRGPAEASATIVQRVLAELGLEDEVLLWNVVPTHPHEPGRPDTNRRPTRGEVESSVLFLEGVARGRRVIAVGRLAERVTGAPYVHHPSRGGAAAFREGLARLL